MVNLGYSLNRINYGLADDNNDGIPSGILDKNAIRLKRTIPGDTIEIYHKFYIKTENPSFSQFEYVRSLMDVSNTGYYAVVSDSVFVNRATGPDSVFAHTPSTLSSRYFNTNLSFMAPFQNNDTVIIKLKLRVISNPAGSTISYNSELAGGASRNNFATNFACGPFIDNQTILGIDNFAYGDQSYTNNGCSKLQMNIQNYFRIAGDNDRYGNFKFPNEVRRFAEVKQMRLTIPDGWLVDSVELYTKTHNTVSNYPLGKNIPHTMINPNLLSFRPGILMQSEGGLLSVGDEGHVFYYTVHLTPTCQTNNGAPFTYRVSDSIVKIQGLHQQTYPFSSPMVGGSVLHYQPNLILSSALPVATAYTKTVNWPISISNLSQFAAEGNWFALKSNSGNVIIDSLKEGATTITPDANGLYRIGTVNSGSSRNFTAFSKSTACNYDSVFVLSSWTCNNQYPTDVFAPIDSVIYAGQTNLTVNGRLVIPANATVPANATIKAVGKITIMPNVSIGSGTNITSQVSIDVRSPNLFWPGVSLNIGNAGICYKNVQLYIQPQPAAIQTQVTALTATPSDPSNTASAAYGSSTIYMCQGFPFEMELQSTQPGTIYNVKEVLTLPFNGGSGLNYVTDSGYIEYPIGTTPRRFSAAANTAILGQVPLGTMTLDLAQIDPTNFGADKGLPGTGLGNNDTRRVKLRWKMRSNCNLVSGEQWQPTQQAISPCGAPAAGNNGITSGFSLDLFGVSKPYVATVKVATGLDGCGSQTTQIRIEKIGAGAPQPTDSITVRLPKTVAAGSVTCSGVACPVGAITYTTRTDVLYQYITFAYPSTASTNGDTLLYSFPMRSRDKATCANNQNVKADVFQQLTIYCGSPIPANLCPNSKSSLGSETKNFDIRKAILGFTGYSSTYVYPSMYKYRFSGNVSNTSTAVAAPTGITLKTFMDINNNLAYEKGIDSLVKTTVISSAIASNGSVGFIDSFENYRYSPSPNLPMYTVIDTGDATANCFCGGVVQSGFNQALPIEFLSVKAVNLNNLTGKVVWRTNTDMATTKFNVYRKTENETAFSFIGSVPNRGGANGINEFVYYNPISSLPTGKIYYQIEAVEQGGISKRSSIVNILKTNAIQSAGLFNLIPNPANAQVSIQLSEGLADGNVKIMDINGKVVFTQSFAGLTTTINTSQLAAGIYSVQVSSNDGIETQKLSVVR